MRQEKKMKNRKSLETLKNLVTDLIKKPLDVPETMIFIQDTLDRTVLWDHEDLDMVFFQLLEKRQGTKVQ